MDRPRTWHVLGRRTSDDPEHAMFWVVRLVATPNMACSRSSYVRRPRTCHVPGRVIWFWATQNMPCSGSSDVSLGDPPFSVRIGHAPVVRASQNPCTCCLRMIWLMHLPPAHDLELLLGDPEHAMFWVAIPPATQNMPCSGSSEVRRPRTCHVPGRVIDSWATQNMACSGSSDVSLGDPPVSVRISHAPVVRASRRPRT